MAVAHGFKKVHTTNMNHLVSTSLSTVPTCKPGVRGVGQRHRFEHRRAAVSAARRVALAREKQKETDKARAERPQ